MVEVLMLHTQLGVYVPSGPTVGGFGIWSKNPVSSNTAVFRYGVYFPADFNFVKGAKEVKRTDEVNELNSNQIYF